MAGGANRLTLFCPGVVNDVAWKRPGGEDYLCVASFRNRLLRCANSLCRGDGGAVRMTTSDPTETTDRAYDDMQIMDRYGPDEIRALLAERDDRQRQISELLRTARSEQIRADTAEAELDSDRAMLARQEEENRKLWNRAEAAEAEAKKWKLEYEFVGGLVKALLPYQIRAVTAEAERDEMLVRALEWEGKTVRREAERDEAQKKLKKLLAIALNERPTYET